MTIDALKKTLDRMQEITRQLYVFASQLRMIEELEKTKKIEINKKEKKLLKRTISTLLEQLRILNRVLPKLIKKIQFYKQLKERPLIKKTIKEKAIETPPVKLNYTKDKKKISLAISPKDKKKFLTNLTKSESSVKKLKKNYSIKNSKYKNQFGKPNSYAKLSNHFFRNLSNHFISKGHTKKLHEGLRKINSPFITATYVSMILFTAFISFLFIFCLFIVLLFYNLTPAFPFIVPCNETIFSRFIKFVWIIFLIPLSSGFIFYYYPFSEGKNIGKKIDQELPFVVIHMSAISNSNIEPTNLFKIILKSKEYRYTNNEFKKLMNLINFNGLDLITALKKTAKTSPSSKLRNLLNGLTTTISSGGDLHSFLDKHSETLLFDYKLDREKYTKSSETFMDIYISLGIAAPMIFLMLFVMMGSTGALVNLLGISVESLSLLIIFAVIILDIGFLIFLKLKQPII